MPDWTDSLPTLDLDSIRPMFDPLEGVETDARRELSADRSIRQSNTHTLVDARGATNALANVGRLPRPQESLHMICKGNYAAFDHIPAALELVKPERLAYVGIVTLSFSARNIATLCELLDARRIESLDLLYSCYFRSVERGEADRLTADLSHRGARVLSMRTHAKITLFETTAGEYFALEGSANLRSRGNLEQCVMTNSAELYRFHREWINEIMEPKK